MATALKRLIMAGLIAIALPAAVLPRAVSAAPTIAAGVEKWRAGAYPEAVAIWAPFAAAGDPDAMFNMGQAYKLGRGVAADPATARDYYRKAAAKGHLPAQANLGITLFQAGDKVEAIRWLRQAADRGDARAQYVLGFAVYYGDGVLRAPGLGYGYLLRSAALGLPQAQTALGSVEPALGASDRAIGETVAASLAATKALPPGLGVNASPRPAVAATPLSPLPTLPTTSAARPAPGMTAPPVIAKPGVVATPAAAGSGWVAPGVAAPAAGTPPLVHATPPVAAVAAPVTVAAAPPTLSPGWRVQLGAYAARSKADEAWVALRGAVDAGMKPIFAGDGGVTRLQIGPYPTHDAAKAACAKLSEAGKACFVVAG